VRLSCERRDRPATRRRLFSRKQRPLSQTSEPPPRPVGSENREIAPRSVLWRCPPIPICGYRQHRCGTAKTRQRRSDRLRVAMAFRRRPRAISKSDAGRDNTQNFHACEISQQDIARKKHDRPMHQIRENRKSGRSRPWAAGQSFAGQRGVIATHVNEDRRTKRGTKRKARKGRRIV